MRAMVVDIDVPPDREESCSKGGQPAVVLPKPSGRSKPDDECATNGPAQHSRKLPKISKQGPTRLGVFAASDLTVPPAARHQLPTCKSPVVSRIHEKRLSGNDNSATVDHGQRSRAGPITAAAAIMTGVFSLHITTDRNIKMIGLGVAVAIQPGLRL